MSDQIGCAAKTLDNGIRYAAMHYTSDEDKRGGWKDKAKVGIPQNEWDREMELFEDVWDGLPVYGSAFRDDWHPWKKSRIPIVQGSVYFGSWDAGQTLQPAFVLHQVTERYQVHALIEVTSNGGESMQAFCPRVLHELQKLLPGMWPHVKHYGDATVTQRSGGNGETAADVARKFGVSIEAVSNTWSPRLSSVEWHLQRSVDAQPGFLIDPVGCPMLYAAYMGAYKYRTSASGEDSGPNAVLLMPLKNMYSHVADADQYGKLAIKWLIEGRGVKRHRGGKNQ